MPQLGADPVTPFTTATSASTAISAKASPGNLMSLTASNANGAVRYLQIHNKASAPSGGDVPVAAWPIAGGAAGSPSSTSLNRQDFGDAGYRCSTGIAVAISTTLGTYTAATAADHVVSGGYV